MIDDENLYGVDNDEKMIMLAQLNMLLNGDGNAILKYKPQMGSLLWKFSTDKELVELDTKMHANGNWNIWANKTKLMGFQVILTNPPFGEDRKVEPQTARAKAIAELYETWNLAKNGQSIDLGILFLENAYRCLGENGRLGIVLSNSIASIPRWAEARKWLLSKMRIVALFDLPVDAFADAVVNTTLIVAYKPPEKELKKIQEQDYEVFTRKIQKIGYAVKTSKRIRYYHPLYKIDDNFEVAIDNEGAHVLDEEFTDTVQEFKEWARGQEETLTKLFL
jgi:type I restriction enzyme M protein